MYSKIKMKQSVLLTGSDAIDLLHRISTVDMKKPIGSDWAPALFLNPQGKILCFFEYTRPSIDSVQINFDENFLEILDQFTFSEKYKIEPVSIKSGGTNGTLSEKDRIEKMIPKVGHEFLNNGETNPLEVNLRGAVHDNKGCYPGQEVIEKIISLGSPAKKLCLLSGVTSESLPTALFDSKTGAEVGTLTSASDGVALGIIRRTHLKENLELKTKTALFTLKKVSP